MRTSRPPEKAWRSKVLSSLVGAVTCACIALLSLQAHAEESHDRLALALRLTEEESFRNMVGRAMQRQPTGSLDSDEVVQIFAEALADVFTKAELAALLDFHMSPAGKSMIKKMPSLVGAVQKRLVDLDANQNRAEPDAGRLGNVGPQP